MRHKRCLFGVVSTVCLCKCGSQNDAWAAVSSLFVDPRSHRAVDAQSQTLTIPIGSALLKVQSNEVYLPPMQVAVQIKLGGAADKRYSLGFN